jgi:hypothetical protein
MSTVQMMTTFKVPGPRMKGSAAKHSRIQVETPKKAERGATKP